MSEKLLKEANEIAASNKYDDQKRVSEILYVLFMSGYIDQVLEKAERIEKAKEAMNEEIEKIAKELSSSPQFSIGEKTGALRVRAAFVHVLEDDSE